MAFHSTQTFLHLDPGLVVEFNRKAMLKLKSLEYSEALELLSSAEGMLKSSGIAAANKL